MSKVNGEIFAGYIPVIHDGYIRALDRHPFATVGILDKEVLSDFDYIRKDIRAVEPEIIEKQLQGMGRMAVILGRRALQEVLTTKIFMPNDDIGREIKRLNPDADITLEPTFLRWDRDNTGEKNSIEPDRVVSIDGDDPIIQVLNKEKSMCTNWWRHVSALVINEHNDISFKAHNINLPTEYTAIYESDPRITSRRGEAIDRNIEAHAELSIIAEAAKRGLSLEGQTIYVTTFPCPTCAKLIALSGIKSCYYFEGYAMLDGERILRDYGVEIVKVNAELEREDPRILKPYPTKS